MNARKAVLADNPELILRATGPGSFPGAIPFSPDSDSACENRENPPEPIFTGVKMETCSANSFPRCLCRTNSS